MIPDLPLFAHAQTLPAAGYPAGVPPEVCDLFERFALDIRRRGFERYSADAVLHRLRWEMHIERGNREFAVNNNWSSSLARWFLAKHPECGKFFELRERRKEVEA
jgi:hypothetical protein